MDCIVARAGWGRVQSRTVPGISAADKYYSDKRFEQPEKRDCWDATREVIASFIAMQQVLRVDLRGDAPTPWAAMHLSRRNHSSG